MSVSDVSEARNAQAIFVENPRSQMKIRFSKEKEKLNRTRHSINVW